MADGVSTSHPPDDRGQRDRLRLVNAIPSGTDKLPAGDSDRCPSEVRCAYRKHAWQQLNRDRTARRIDSSGMKHCETLRQLSPKIPSIEYWISF